MLAEHARFSDQTIAIVTIKNACVESTLISVRDIDDFFRPRSANSRDSDLRSTDFDGYQSPGPFLSNPERDSINQWVAHLTYQPVWTGTTGIAPESAQTWDTAQFVGRAAHAVFGFLDHVVRELSQKHSDYANDIRKIRMAFDLGLKQMQALAALEAEQFAKNANKSDPKS